jgi:hypothetical protein
MSAILTTGSTGTALTSTFNTNSHFRSNLIFPDRSKSGVRHQSSIVQHPIGISSQNFMTGNQTMIAGFKTRLSLAYQTSKHSPAVRGENWLHPRGRKETLRGALEAV